jgi:phage antirepressor YoqD-like protein
MEFVHIDSEAFNKLKKQLDNIEREIRKLRDPVQVVSSEWITIDEAAQILRVSRRTMFTYMRKKTITPNRINRKSTTEEQSHRGQLKLPE